MKDLQPTITQQNEVVNKLKAGLEGMRGKLDELESKRDELIARAKMAEAQSGVMDAVKEIDLTDPTSELSRFEEKIRREEAKVAGKAELAASRLDVQFEALEDEETRRRGRGAARGADRRLDRCSAGGRIEDELSGRPRRR